MEYIFKTDDLIEAKIQMAANDNYNILWEIKHNFHRNFKHIEGSEEFFKGVHVVLDKLELEIEEFKPVE